ncbi:hypothetical protein W02_17980 [Nitrospira sp. KM1]|nr:hypothetical protein W02_17980 [Nitrospira sp. KM1]
MSWYQTRPLISLELIRETGVAPHTAQIIDVGGGASSLADGLLADGYLHLTVLDVSRAALDHARERLGARANAVTWIEADMTTVTLPQETYDVWHDRAAFHFLTESEQRRRYVEAVRHALRPGGHVIIATFALDGPTRCSGLEVMRHSSMTLGTELGARFELMRTVQELHRTPGGREQAFQYSLFKKH